MLSSLLYAIRQRNSTDAVAFPDLSERFNGLPLLTSAACLGESCNRCASVCPTGAIVIGSGNARPVVTLDRGLCVTCSACVETCPSGTILFDRSTKTAVRTREELVLKQPAKDESNSIENAPIAPESALAPLGRLLSRSMDVRVVSTGCSATDLEVSATTNPIFDCSRFGIHYVASPRHADILLVTGPVPKAMHDPLNRCFESMADPRIVIAVGSCAISGGVHRGGYAEANGVVSLLPVSAFVPGCPPHPWSITHGILLAAESPEV